MLARDFPTLCLQDEFFFFPRVSEARHTFYRAAQVEEQVIQGAWDEVAGLLASLNLIPWQGLDPEAAADLIILRQSMRGFLQEMGAAGVWSRDPLFYLKSASLSLFPVLSRSPLIGWREEECLAELLVNLARLLGWGRRQVKKLTPPLKVLAQEAFADTARFFTVEVSRFFRRYFPNSLWWPPLLADLLKKLAAFRDQVMRRPVTPEFRLGADAFRSRLQEMWGVQEDLPTIAGILAQEQEEATRSLETLAGSISPSSSWHEILAAYRPPPEVPAEPLKLYRREVRRLKRFWQRSPVLPPLAGTLRVAPTPLYLRALRATASYTAPWLYQQGLPGFFYISPAAQEPAHRWRQHRFLCAHETYPGHHYLDLRRLSLPSLVRRQYESPLYYEGWACYAETLLTEQKYIVAPQELLIGWQRRLWRALRGQVDLKLHTGRLDLEGAVTILGQAGYPFPARQVLRWAVNPGYQLCYPLGLRHLLRLRELFASALNLRACHEILLSGGQLPFWLLEKRLRQAAAAE